MRSESLRPIFIERLTYGKPVSDTGAVPFGRDYEVTSRSRGMAAWKEALLRPSRLLGGAGVWGADWVEPDAARKGCLLVIPVRSPDLREHGYVAGRIRFRSEGGDDAGGRPYLQSSFWFIDAEDWRRGYARILARMSSGLAADPDPLPGADDAYPWEAATLELPAQPAGADAPVADLPLASAAIALSAFEHARGAGPLRIGRRDCRDEAAFLDVVRRAIDAMSKAGADPCLAPSFACGFRGPAEGLHLIFSPSPAIEPVAESTRQRWQEAQAQASKALKQTSDVELSSLRGLAATEPHEDPIASFEARRASVEPGSARPRGVEEAGAVGLGEECSSGDTIPSARPTPRDARHPPDGLPPFPKRVPTTPALRSWQTILQSRNAPDILLFAYDAWDRRKIDLYDHPQDDRDGKLCMLAALFGERLAVDFSHVYLVAWTLEMLDRAGRSGNMPFDVPRVRDDYLERVVHGMARRRLYPPDECRWLRASPRLDNLLAPYADDLSEFRTLSGRLLDFSDLEPAKRRNVSPADRRLVGPCIDICRDQIEQVEALVTRPRVIEELRERFAGVKATIEDWDRNPTNLI